MIKAPQNHIFVKVESEYNDEHLTKEGNKLFLTTSQFHVDDDSNHIPTMIRRHYGTVIAAPIKLTDEVKIQQVDPGLPTPAAYISNEKLNEMGSYASSWASLNTFVFKWKTCADLEMEVEAGDKIYFHHNTITEDNLVPEIGDKVYKLTYSNAICVVREHIDWERGPDGDNQVINIEIIPIAGHILVKPLWEDGVQDIGDGKKGKVSASGIITELHEKPKALRATVTHVSAPLKNTKMELSPGDNILYLPHSDYKVTIEGEEFYVMKYWEVIAKF